MAASMYIVVEGEDPGYNTYVNGRMLARHEGAVEALALRLGVPPLLEFFSADENSMQLLLQEGAGNPDLLKRLPPPQWYGAEAGLATVSALVAAFADQIDKLEIVKPESDKPGGVPRDEASELLNELREYERVLEKTAQRGLRWHLAVSWR